MQRSEVFLENVNSLTSAPKSYVLIFMADGPEASQSRTLPIFSPVAKYLASVEYAIDLN